MARLKVKVARLTLHGSGNLSVHLERLDGQVLPVFEAGAHIDVFLPGDITRQYSIASPPSQRGRYELCVKNETASRGGSRFVHDELSLGDELDISEPRNLFSLKPAEHYVLIAAGIGITPLLSMAADLQEKNSSFSLHYYTKNAAQTAFLEYLQTAFSSDRINLRHSDDGNSPRNCLPDDLEQPMPETLLYLCGPQPFMTHMTEQAMRRGWGSHQMHREAFSTNGFAPQEEDQPFEVQLVSSGDVFQVEVGESIAQVLCNAGLDVPLSCEQGICGACLTGVLQGTPCHRDSVLSESEKAMNNQITLCCSRSLSERLVLDL
ncbi:PDR/VanB family oxidoreductase [Pseudomonas cerasi]